MKQNRKDLNICSFKNFYEFVLLIEYLYIYLIHIPLYIYITCVYVYGYISMYRDRDKEKQREIPNTWLQKASDAIQQLGIIYLSGKIQTRDVRIPQ